MEVACHIGAHCTDDDRLLKSLNRNAETLAEHGVAVPEPELYRDTLGELITSLRGAEATGEMEDALLESMLSGADPDRVILSGESLISMPARAVEDGQLYARAHKAAWIRRAFPGCEVSFHLAIRNPASLLPALARRCRGGEALEIPADPRALRWSDTVARLRAACPDSPVTVWCHEDSPVIWSDILRDLAALEESVSLAGGFDMLRVILTSEGMNRLRAYTKAHPPANEAARRKVIAAFLDKFADPTAVEEEIDLPGWDAALVEELTALYEADLDAIAQLPDVRVLVP